MVGLNSFTLVWTFVFDWYHTRWLSGRKTWAALLILDSTIPKRHTVSSDKVERIACWNIKSLGNPTKFNIRLINTIETMKEKNLTLLAMSEVQGVGKGLLEIEETTVIYSGLDEKREGNQRGVAIGLRGKKKAHTPWYRKEL